MTDDAHSLMTEEWLESLDLLLADEGAERAQAMLATLATHARASGVRLPFTANTDYINTISPDDEPAYPGNLELERRLRNVIRWNAMAMVVRANREESGIGGHISTYASAANLYEVAFHHCFRAPRDSFEGDQVYFQGHASPGIYARAYLEGRLTESQLENFRRELKPGGGLSSYPHPWLMPKFWTYPTVSMGLSPIMAIYQARFMRYLEDRGLKPRSDAKVWAFLGDGECDEPESLGALTLAARERLDNLIFVVNCNLQRLDGPVRGNGKIIQELEAAFRGAGWNVIKVIWGRHWDPLLYSDNADRLILRMNEVVDGQYQRYKAESGRFVREHFFGADPLLLDMVAHLSDDDIWRLNRGGHDSVKLFAAYQRAMGHRGQPSVILAKTIKGYGLGESGEGRNISHQQKKLNEDELKHFRTRFHIPLSDDEVAAAPFFKPPAHSPEMRYLRERRQDLGGFLPERRPAKVQLQLPDAALYEEFWQDAGTRELATTMAFVRLLSKYLRHPHIGKHIVPIIPDEARTFGMESLFREVGIYSHAGQLYEPVDAGSLLYYREAQNGQILEEGITEAGAMSSFIAAAASYATMQIPMIPFFIFYSMFGFQRIGDLIWAAGDMRCRGFLLGATAGRTTLAGEGLQHQDGNSQLLAYTVPNLRVYDPAFAFEIAVIVRDGLERMYQQNEDIFYYLTVENEPYHMPAKPPDVDEGIIRGLYRFRTASVPTPRAQAQLLGSGAIMREALLAQQLLAEHFQVAADVWSVTSYKALYYDAIEVERWNLLHPADVPRIPYIAQCLRETSGVCIAASDYVKALPESVARAAGRPWVSLGTDGFGRSEGRTSLRRFFGVDAAHIAYATVVALVREGLLDRSQLARAQQVFAIDVEQPNPITV